MDFCGSSPQNPCLRGPARGAAKTIGRSPLWIINSFAQQIYMNKSIFNSQEGSVSRKEKQTEQGSTYQQNWGLSTVKICGCRLICRWPIQTEVVGKFRVNLLRKQEFIQINLTHQISRVTKEHVRNTKPTTNCQRHGRRDYSEPENLVGCHLKPENSFNNTNLVFLH
jgi:hypothetical protein